MAKKVKSHSKRVTKQDMIDQLTENNIQMQKITTNLITSVNNLTDKVHNLVTIFEKAAEHIEKGDIKEPLARKLTDLLEQNKRIAKGLILLEKYVRDKETFSSKPSQKVNFEDSF